jgi:DNA polymerase III alpha subunit
VFESKDELRALLRRKPNWKLLENKEIVEKLFHLSKHFDIIDEIKPTSVLEIADILALIRPGKIKLLNKYIKDKKNIRTELYTKREKSDLRKPHAIAYALLVVVQLNLIDLGLL